MIFFTDRDLGARIFPEVLRTAGLDVRIHVDHFPHDSPDEVWLPEVARNGWYVLSNDKGILRGASQRSAVLASGVGLFILVGGHIKAETIARNFVNTVDKVHDFAATYSRPFIAKIYRPSPKELVDTGRPGKVDLFLGGGPLRT